MSDRSQDFATIFVLIRSPSEGRRLGRQLANPRTSSRRLFGRAVSGGNGLSNSSSRSRRSLRVTDSPARPNRRASDCPTLIFMFRRRRFAFSHRFAFQFDPIGVVDQSIQYGIGYRGIRNNFVPLIDRELAGNEGGSLTLAVIEYLQGNSTASSWRCSMTARAREPPSLPASSRLISGTKLLQMPR